MSITIRKNIEVKRKGLPVVIDVTYGTDLIQMEFKVTDCIIPAESSAVAYSQGRTAEVHKQICTIDENVISFSPEKGFFEEGHNELQLRVVHNNRSLFTFKCRVECQGSFADSDAEEVKRNSSLVEQLMTEQAVTKARLEEVLKLPDEGTDVEKAVNDIKVGADGKVYPSPGEAVRQQIGQVSEQKANKNEIPTKTSQLTNDSDYVKKSVTDSLEEQLDTLNQGGLNLKEEFIVEQVNEWLDEHPEATTTVQDNSLTIDKMVVGTLGYVTPQMFGAKGDGVTDDTVAFKNTIENSDVIVLKGTYKISENIEITERKTITSLSDIIGGDSGIIFENGCGFIFKSRYITLKNVSITGNNSGTCIVFDNAEHAHFIAIENVLINKFETAFKNNTIMWDCTFTNIRVNNCTNGFVAHDTYSSMLITFINVYFNRVKQILNARGMTSIFIGCNFGICDTNAILIENNTNICFMNCNFEWDELPERGGTVFVINSLSTKFVTCDFKVKANENNFVFETYAQMENLSFENCHYENYGGTMPITNFFNKSHLSSNCYGAIKFIGGCSSMPRPSNLTSGQMMNWIDFEKGRPLTMWKTWDASKLSVGQFVYDTNVQKILYFNGTNLCDISDNTVVY